MARRWPFGLMVCVCVLGIGGAVAPAVSAHARLKTSEPVAGAAVAHPPAQVILTFTEETSATKSGGSVTDAAGATVSTGFAVDLNERTKMTIPLKPGLGPGAYTVQYHTFTDDDGGIVDDHFTFTVGAGGAAPATGATAAPVVSPAANATIAATRGPSVTLVPAVSTPAGSAAASATAANGAGGIPALVWVIVAVVVVGVIAFGARLVTARR